MYLREPLTQTRLAYHTRASVVFELTDSAPSAYVAAGDLALAAIPAFSGQIVRRPEQWRLIARPHRRVVVKEVNPIALDWVVDRYAVRVIYLVRHPAAVAASYRRLGWTGRFGKRFSDTWLRDRGVDPGGLDSPWAEFGAFQAVVHEDTLRALGKAPLPSFMVRYESLCRDPEGTVEELCGFASLAYDGDLTRRVVETSTTSGDRSDHPYGIHRDSLAMVSAWRTEFTGRDLAELRDGYLAYSRFYGPDEW
jgi:hypothetical protein